MKQGSPGETEGSQSHYHDFSDMNQLERL